MRYQTCEECRKERAIIILFKTGKRDPEGTAFCEHCAREALNSGNYSEESTDDLERNYEG